MINRRDFLKNASLFTLGGLMAGKVGSADAAKPVTSETMAAKTVGLQIYSLGKELYADVPGGLKKIKQMGYTNLELAGYKEGKIGGVDMMEFKKMVDDAGLKITSSHVNPPVREYTKANRSQISEYWKKTADDHAKLGVKYLIQPGQPSTRSTEETAFVCEIFNEAGKIVKAAGIPFGYHNHEMEFAKVNPGSTEAKLGRRVKGDCIYELFLKNTDPSLIFRDGCLLGRDGTTRSDRVVEEISEPYQGIAYQGPCYSRRVRDDEFREYIPASLREWNQGLFRGVGGYA